jgi:hypothetical protein
MNLNPYFLIALEGLNKIFIYYNKLRYKHATGRNKGFKGLKVPVHSTKGGLSPFNPLFLSGDWLRTWRGQGDSQGTSSTSALHGCTDREKALVSETAWGGHPGVVCVVKRVVIKGLFQ